MYNDMQYAVAHTYLGTYANYTNWSFCLIPKYSDNTGPETQIKTWIAELNFVSDIFPCRI